MSFWFGRLKTSLIGPDSAVVNSFCHVKADWRLIPCEKRLVTLACIESYHWLPRGASESEMVVNCGNGRRACARVWPTGKVAYGSLNPAAATFAAEIFDVNKVRLAALVTLRPNWASRAGVRAFKSTMLEAANQTPRLPT